MNTNTRSSQLTRIILVAGLLGMSAFVACAQRNLIINGSFEAGGQAGVQNFPGWDMVGPADNNSDFGVAQSSTFPDVAEQGNYYAYFHGNPTDSSQDCLGQTLTNLTIGAKYTISFDLATDGPTPGTNASMYVLIGTTFPIDYVHDVLLAAYVPDATNSQPYRHFTTNITATATSEILAFHGVDGTSSILLDNVSMTLAGAVIPPAKPTLSITNFLTGQHVSNDTFMVIGKTADNLGVAEVSYNLNSSGWNVANTTNNWTNWFAILNLLPGTNTFAVYAVDTSGNQSLTNVVKLVYVVSDLLTVSTIGRGSVTPNYNLAELQISNRYTMTALPAAGFAFTNWTDGNGNFITNKQTLGFVMASNLAFVAKFVDVQKPVLNIANLPANGSVSNAPFVLLGKTSDNVGVVSVSYNLNNGGWNNSVSSGNNFTNWSASLPLVPGLNTIAAYAEDAAGNVSATNTVHLTYIVSAQLTVSTNGRGTVSPNDNGAFLQISNRYTLTATPTSGFAFTNWTDGSGNYLTNKPVLSFVMASNLAFVANFIDVTKPTVSVTNLPLAGRVSNELFTIKGRAADNVAVSNVFFNLNGIGWNPAVTTNSWTNWSAQLDLTPGSNNLSIYAVDTSGNLSATNALVIFYVVNATVSVQIVGKGILVPNYNGQSLAIGKSFYMRAAPAPGFVFSYWSGDVPMTTGSLLIFNVASNENIIANFVDVVKPAVTITYPVANQRCSNAVITATGSASDNAGVASVWVQINNGGWTPVVTGNGYTNWIATNLTVTVGTNLLQAYARDAAGNVSSVKSVQFIGAVSTVSSADGMALIPAGRFTMGNSIRDADITDAEPTEIALSAFFMDTNLISYGQWQSVYSYALNHGYRFDNRGLGVATNHPVQAVSWFDVVKWSNARSQQAGLTPVYYTDAGLTQPYTNGTVAPFVNWSANGYRLPTEAEWEKAARGGLIAQRFPWGNTISQHLANYYGDTTCGYDFGPNGYNTNFDLVVASVNDSELTSPAGSFSPNWYGLYDMAGNLEEWCWDWYGTNFGQPTTTNPTGPANGSSRVIRGGGWDGVASECRCAARSGSDVSPGSRGSIGFRCVRTY